MALLTETTVQLGDLVIAEWDYRHTREQATIQNPQAVAYADQNLWGLLVKNITRVNDDVYRADLVLAADVANVQGIILKKDIISFTATGGANDETTKRYPVLVRGPAIINKDQIRALDPAGAAYNLDTVATILAARGIVVRAEPDKAMSWGL